MLCTEYSFKQVATPRRNMRRSEWISVPYNIPRMDCVTYEHYVRSERTL
jgi:hypothetical protein